MSDDKDRVIVVQGASYDYPALKGKFYEMMDSLGGGRIGAGCKVLIKPNFLGPAPPEKAILTHPMLVRAAAEYALGKGARVQVSDSQAMGSFEKIVREGGFDEALKGLDVRLSEFRTSVTVDAGEPFKKLELAREALSADHVINLPKLKTHTQMLLTLGVKNMFGCIVGMKKAEWHLRAGIDREVFASLLVKVYSTVSPGFTILDGILAMQGQGPGRSGTPRELGVLMGSRDAVALDAAVCRMLGVEPLELPTNRAARELGLWDADATPVGGLPKVENFKLPEMTPLVFGPKVFHGFMRRHLIQRPECDASLCTQCGECMHICHAGSIEYPTKGGVTFDYDKCIRCYCCVEVCPEGALRTAETRSGKAIRTVLRRR